MKQYRAKKKTKKKKHVYVEIAEKVRKTKPKRQTNDKTHVNPCMLFKSMVKHEMKRDYTFMLLHSKICESCSIWAYQHRRTRGFNLFPENDKQNATNEASKLQQAYFRKEMFSQPEYPQSEPEESELKNIKEQTENEK